MFVDDNFKKLLQDQIDFKINPESMDMFLSAMTPRELADGEILIDKGDYDTNVYILKEGITRYVDVTDDKERTYAFALPSTFFSSYYCFYLNRPSYYKIDACCPSVVLVLSREKYWELVTQDSNIAQWMLNIAIGQVAFFEYVYSNLKNGNARQRFISLMKERPEILRRVKQKIVASYLGISPEYFSTLKRNLFNKK